MHLSINVINSSDLSGLPRPHVKNGEAFFSSTLVEVALGMRYAARSHMRTLNIIEGIDIEIDDLVAAKDICNVGRGLLAVPDDGIHTGIERWQ